MIHTLILKEASPAVAPTTQHNNRATPDVSGGLYRINIRIMTVPDVTLNLGYGVWMLTLKNGAMFWQGPHHVAVKSTTTNLFPAFFRALSKAGCKKRERKEKLILFLNYHDTFLPAEVRWNERWVIMLWLLIRVREIFLQKNHSNGLWGNRKHSERGDIAFGFYMRYWEKQLISFSVKLHLSKTSNYHFIVN